MTSIVAFVYTMQVSAHQTSVSWPDVATAGRSFAFVKASQGDSYADPYFLPNRMPLAAANLNNNVSAYHFADPDEYNDHSLNPSLSSRLSQSPRPSQRQSLNQALTPSLTQSKSQPLSRSMKLPLRRNLGPSKSPSPPSK